MGTSHFILVDYMFFAAVNIYEIYHKTLQEGRGGRPALEGLG